MKKIFSVGEGFKVPDGTVVHSVVDPRIAGTSESAFLGKVSVAVGVIPANTTSKIHVHPVVTQIAWVISGNLTVKMKDPQNPEPYSLELSAEESVVTMPGTFFQLINLNSGECRVLYIVAPAFLFECDAKGNVIYNDALVMEEDWDALSSAGWRVPLLADMDKIHRLREESKKRLGSPPL